MNGLKAWVYWSREQQRRHPERYLAYWAPKLWMDETHVRMTSAQLYAIKNECGRYDGTLPTGEYLGKMFLRGESLCWFSISKDKPMTHVHIQCRTIEIVEEEND